MVHDSASNMVLASLSQSMVVLKALQVATKALSLEQNVSSSLIYPIIHGLINCHLKVDPIDFPTIKRFKETVTSQLEDHFSFDPKNIAILVAAVDPRYKDLDFLKNEEREEVESFVGKHSNDGKRVSGY